MVYRLANGKILDEKGIFIALTNDNVFNHYFLDVKTGKVKLVSEEFDIEPDKLLKKIKSKLNQRYFEIPKISEEERRSWMKEFVEEMIAEKMLKNKLNFILSKSRSFQVFESVLYPDKSGWIWGWVQNKVFKLADKLAEWLDEIDIEVKEGWEYDDNCPLCQLLKKADEEGETPTMEETKKSFLKAKEKCAIVGGEWFDKSNKKNYKKYE